MEYKSGMSEKEIEECANGMLEAMRGRVKNDKESGLTDNEVREVAKMQRELDAMYYMLFHLEAFARGEGDGFALLASSDDFVNQYCKTLYNFIKEHRETKNEEK